MIKIFPTEKIKELDQYTIQNEPISSIDLVERAAMTFTNEFTRNYTKQNRIIVFAGQGNNGADALAIARLLADIGYKVIVFLLNPTRSLSADCSINKQRLSGMENVEFTEIISGFDAPDLTNNDIVIDGLFGSGLNRPLKGGFAAISEYINQSDATIISIDIPSGLYGENNIGNNFEAITRAHKTYTFAFPKLSFFFPENKEYVGKWQVLDILLHPDIIKNTKTPFFQVQETDIASLFQPRDRFAHKGDFGHAFLIAGSRGKMGAALLSAKACLRSGAGLLTVHIPGIGETIMQTAFPEAMIDIDKNDNIFTEFPDITKYNAIGVGPGIGTDSATVVALDKLLQQEKPLVLDADAINIIALNSHLIEKLNSLCILTPHPKEFDRLAGKSETSYERLLKAQKFAVEHQVCIVLKGAYTATCTPKGNIYFNSTGNPGMATAGSGDVLTGIILSLLVQGFDQTTSAIAAVYIHGLAGDIASNQESEESLIAEDIVNTLGQAFKRLK